jgi:hypothetical protein
MNRTLTRFAFFVLALAMPLAACETPPPPQKLPEITFKHLAPIKLNVATVDIVVRYRPPMKAPNVDHVFPTPPLKALRTWAADRIKAVGRSGKAEFVIDVASAVEQPLQKKTGFTATFTKQQEARYDLLVEASIEVSDGLKHDRAVARASRFITTREDVTLTQRDRIWFDETEKLMAEFNAEMDRNVQQFLGGWIR